MDDRLFRNAMGKFATGVTVVTTEVDDEKACAGLVIQEGFPILP